MPLVISPLFALNSQYRPNYFVMSMASANPLVLAQAAVVVAGSTVSSMSKSPAYNIGSTYYFEFDVAKILQTVSAPKAEAMTTVFAKNKNTSYDDFSEDIHSEVGLIVSYFYNDPVTGLLTNLGVVDTVPIGYPAIAGTRQTRDYNSMGMNSYILDYPAVGGVYDLYFLTKLQSVYPTASTKTTNPILISNGEDLTMSYVPSANTNALRVVVYDENQSVVGSAGFIQITSSSNLTPRTIGAGIEQLLATTMTPSNPMSAIQTGYYYSIQAGNLILPSTFILQGVKYMFKVVEKCEHSVRLHWLNRLGGADAYTFKSKKVVSEKTKSSTAQKPLRWDLVFPPTTLQDKGMFKFQQETIREYEVTSTFYTPEQGEWIAELLSSPEVYMETDYGLIAIVVTDGSITTFENEELLTVTVKFIEANEISLQQN